MNPDKLTPTAAAKRLNVSVADLARMREDGTGPTFTILLTRDGEPKPPRYRLADVEAWIDEQYVGGLFDVPE